MRFLWSLLVLMMLMGCTVSPTPSSPTPTPPRLTVTRAPSATPTLGQINSPTASRRATLTLSPEATPSPPSLTNDPTSTRTAVLPPTSVVAPLSIITFTFAPALIDPGDAVTLTWQVVGAEHVTIYRILDYRLTMPAYEVPLTGSRVLTTYESERNFASFALFASAGGQSIQAGVTIPIRCPDSWFFANPPAACPYATLNTNWVAQDFEHGQMFWAESSDRIYILYAGGNRWSATQNSWFEGMPEFDPTLIPPAGYFQPVRGFGLVWRDEQALEGYRVRDQLGWAITQEYAWGAGAWQCTAVTKYSTCYLGDPEGIVYELKPEGSGWEVWHGPAP